MRRALAIASLLVAAGCHRGSRSQDVQLVFAADQLGYLAPCGCSEHQLGGAARAAGVLLARAKLAPTLFLQGGNLLFGSLTPKPDERRQLLDKARALGESWRMASAGATPLFQLGPYDLALGDGAAREALGKVPLLAAPRTVDVGGLLVGLLPLAGPLTGRPADALRAAGAQLVVALAQAPRPAEAQAWGQAAGADLVLQAGVPDPVADTDEAALLPAEGPPAFRVKDKGRSLLVLTIHRASGAPPGLVVPEPAAQRALRAKDLEALIASDEARLSGAQGPLRELLQRKVAELGARRDELRRPSAPPTGRNWADFAFLELGDGSPEAPAVSQIVERYNAEVAKENLAAQTGKVCPAAKANELHYVGVETCRGCHADAAQVWDKTKHRHAYETLVGKGRQFDVECIGCHVLGYEQPGGVCRLDQVGPLGGVQCEACHGMGSTHADSAGGSPMPNPKPDMQTCLHCHTPDNDTRFSRESYVSYYLPGILGPGHGKPSP
ncbi:MAG: multiheme c-type cytochrome [Deltaproteobacteria bacterium]